MQKNGKFRKTVSSLHVKKKSRKINYLRDFIQASSKVLIGLINLEQRPDQPCFGAC